MVRHYWVALILICLVAPKIVVAEDHPYQNNNVCSDYRLIDGSKIHYASDLQKVSDNNDDEMVAITNIKLYGENLSGLELTNLCFVKPDFAKTIWDGAKGRSLIFYNANLEDSSWKAYDGETLTFQLSNLKNAVFTDGIFRGVKFDTSNIEKMNARNADLSNGSFSGNWSSYLTDARFDNANMSGFQIKCGRTSYDICGQYSKNVSFRGANLTNAIISIPYIDDLDFSNVTLKNTSIPLHLSTYLRDANILGPVKIIAAPWNAMRYSGQNSGQYDIILSADEFKQLAPNIYPLHISAIQPSFDCGRAVTRTEMFICHVPRFSRSARFAIADAELHRAYDAALAVNPRLVVSQRQWLKERDACLDEPKEEYEYETCVGNKYRDRTELLWNMVKLDIDLAIGEKMIFVNAAEYMSESFRSTELFSKVAQVVAVSSWNYVVVERKANGRLYAEGHAVGSNGNLGGLFSPSQGLIYNEKSGCYGTYSDVEEKWGEEKQFFPIIGIRGDKLVEGNSCSVDPEPEYNDYIVLGSRGHFSPMRRLPLTTKQIDQLTSRI